MEVEHAVLPCTVYDRALHAAAAQNGEEWTRTLICRHGRELGGRGAPYAGKKGPGLEIRGGEEEGWN